MFIVRIISIISILLCSTLASSQTIQKSEFEALRNIFDKEEKKSYFTLAKKDISNEFEFLFSGLFFAYKELISSQDAARCMFSPSCSVYAIESIKKHGIVTGLLATFDRLSRCNGINQHQYEIDEKTGLCTDPVDQ